MEIYFTLLAAILSARIIEWISVSTVRYIMEIREYKKALKDELNNRQQNAEQ